MRWYEPLRQNQVEQIHEASLQILEKTGVDFHHPPAIEILSRSGAKTEGERVFFPPRLVEEQVKKSPDRFKLYARNSEWDVEFGGEKMVFCPGYGAPFVMDIESGRRNGTLEDFKRFVQLTQASVYQDICSGMVIEPNDVPYGKRHAQMLYTTVRYSDKCFMGSPMGARAARDSIQMASILFGSKADLIEKPRFISLLGALTPLKYDNRTLEAIMAYADAGQPLIISTLGIEGATAPVTLAGTLALQNAEVLAGIVLTQLVREGTPVIFGGVSSSAEMRLGTLSIGSPEMAINTAATAQMARYYRLPSRSGGAVCDAKIADVQAAYESMMNLMMAQVSGIHFVLHSAGILETYNCMSYEKFVIDDETCGMVKKTRRAYEVNPETLAVDLVKEVGPGGHFLDKKHTLDHFKDELYQPMLSNRDNYHNWFAKGSPQAIDSATKKYKEILENHVPPDLPLGVNRGLQEFIAAI